MYVASTDTLAVTPSLTAFVPFQKPDEKSLAQHYTAMMRFAKRKVRDEALAEEAVQEAMLAAWQHADRFAGQSSLKTWMLGILNHKIQDMFRKESRYVSLTSYDSEGEEIEFADGHPNASVSWGLDHDETGPDSSDPLNALMGREMQLALTREIMAMPENLRAVFERQVVEDRDTDDVCAELGITPANAWVRLHRARKHLSARMQAHLN
jgi:RNA polymerase sigma-70 factor, ECF subfamily